jgi:hypothetical protein
MDAIVSGEAGVAVLIEGQSAWLQHYGDSGKREAIDPVEAVRLLRPFADQVVLRNTNPEVVGRQLLHGWTLDRVTRLALIALDRNESDQIRWQAARAANELMPYVPASIRLINRLFGIPFGTDAGLSLTDGAGSKLFYFDKVLSYPIKYQPQIAAYSSSWHAALSKLFTNPHDKASCFEVAVEKGVFRKLAMATHENRLRKAVLDDCATMLREIDPEGRILETWVLELYRLGIQATPTMKIVDSFPDIELEIIENPLDALDFRIEARIGGSPIRPSDLQLWPMRLLPSPIIQKH